MASDLFGIIPASWFGWIDGALNSSFWVIIIALFAFAGGALGYRKVRDKEIFKYPVRIFRRRENKQPKEINCVGGYIKGSDGIQLFRIKLHKWKWWQRVDLQKIPDAQFMDEENRVYYYQLDPTHFIQAKRKFNEIPIDSIRVKFIKPYLNYKIGDELEVTVESAVPYLERGYVEKISEPIKNFGLDAYYEPIPTDTKRVVVMGLSNAREALKLDLFKLQAMTIGAIVIIAITFIVAYYLLNARGAVG